MQGLLNLSSDEANVVKRVIKWLGIMKGGDMNWLEFVGWSDYDQRTENDWMIGIVAFK